VGFQYLLPLDELLTIYRSYGWGLIGDIYPFNSENPEIRTVSTAPLYLIHDFQQAAEIWRGKDANSLRYYTLIKLLTTAVGSRNRFFLRVKDATNIYLSLADIPGIKSLPSYLLLAFPKGKYYDYDISLVKTVFMRESLE